MQLDKVCCKDVHSNSFSSLSVPPNLETAQPKPDVAFKLSLLALASYSPDLNHQVSLCHYRNAVLNLAMQHLASDDPYAVVVSALV